MFELFLNYRLSLETMSHEWKHTRRRSHDIILMLHDTTALSAVESLRFLASTIWRDLKREFIVNLINKRAERACPAAPSITFWSESVTKQNECSLQQTHFRKQHRYWSSHHFHRNKTISLHVLQPVNGKQSVPHLLIGASVRSFPCGLHNIKSTRLFKCRDLWQSFTTYKPHYHRLPR